MGFAPVYRAMRSWTKAERSEGVAANHFGTPTVIARTYGHVAVCHRRLKGAMTNPVPVSAIECNSLSVAIFRPPPINHRMSRRRRTWSASSGGWLPRQSLPSIGECHESQDFVGEAGDSCLPENGSQVLGSEGRALGVGCLLSDDLENGRRAKVEPV